MSTEVSPPWMMSRIIPLAIFLLLPSVFFGQVQVFGKQTKHEASQYDEAGTFRITLDVPRSRRMDMAAEINDFIWDHWNEHRRGRLQMITQSIEGQVKIQKVVIRPDAHGRWLVQDEIQADVHRAAYTLLNHKLRLMSMTM